MEGRIKKWKSNRNVFRLLQHRENNADLGKVVRQYYQFTNSLIKRLGLEAELQGHQGCVNCLQWTSDGRLLASGSDDTNIIFWDPFRHKLIEVIPTPHIGNIFSVKFLGTNNSVIATAAGDCRVIVQSIYDAKTKNPPLLDCSCHVGRVKRLATAPDQPMLFWSAGEDGIAIQYDMREPHECSSARSKVFVDLSHTSELKCITVNPTRPHLVAVGANDCFVRLYDRRKVKVTSISINHSIDHRRRTPPDPIDPNCVQYFAPGHLARENSKVMSFKLAATYVAFNSYGTEMLVNMGCEQIYLFDINKSRHINELKYPDCFPRKKTKMYKSCCLVDGLSNKNGVNINNDNDVNINKNLCACDYEKRAKELYERRWMGDVYAAARDYLYVIQYWPTYKQAYVGLLNCLVALKWKKEAKTWLEYFLKLYPDCKDTPQVHTIEKDIEAIANTPEENNEEPITGNKVVPEDEQKLRFDSYDFELRFLGHCNATTDIKEANFLGEDGNYICAGSDDGVIFIWDRRNTEIITALQGDCSIVNCVQPHPSACLIASSGIDTAVKIWSPSMEDGSINSKLIPNIPVVVKENQNKLAMDPFETMLANMGYRIRDGPFEDVPLSHNLSVTPTEVIVPTLVNMATQ